MDNDQIMQQESQNEGNDSFLDGWEEANSGQEEAVPGGDGGKEAAGQEKGEAKNGRAPDSGGQGGEGGAFPGTGAGHFDKGGDGGSGGAGLPSAGGDGSSPGIDAGRFDGGGSGSPGGEQPSPAGGGGQPGGQTEGGQQPPPPPKTWTVAHMGQPVTISETDVPVLAQKALDYDRVRSAYEEARPVMELFQGFARQAGMPVQDYVARIRAQAKEAQGMDQETARRAVELEDREARLRAQESADRARQEAARQAQAAQAQRQARIQSDIQEFISVFPNAALDFKSIPQEVWDAVNGGMSLVAAYARYNSAHAQASAQAAEAELQRQEAVQRQNAQNAAASTGSMKSAGSSHGPKDPFLEGWDE